MIVGGRTYRDRPRPIIHAADAPHQPSGNGFLFALAPNGQRGVGRCDAPCNRLPNSSRLVVSTAVVTQHRTRRTRTTSAGGPIEIDLARSSTPPTLLPTVSQQSPNRSGAERSWAGWWRAIGTVRQAAFYAVEAANRRVEPLLRSLLDPMQERRTSPRQSDGSGVRSAWKGRDGSPPILFQDR
jgi:hypothetical protein